MNVVNRGFLGRRDPERVELPPGQYLTRDFPVLQAGPTPSVPLDQWRFTVRAETGAEWAWTWPQLLALPRERPTVDIHCVTRWSKLATTWEGVSLDTLFAEVETVADYALVRSHGGYTTNLPLADLLDGQAWIAFGYDGEELAPAHGGPARLLVPHLYFWKSAKWVSGIDLHHDDEPGFWESLGYHEYGDPWREQRYTDD
ncbi:sulfite oxidase-like oxidoreductase [Actinophytocola xinjiangensis]|uniref:Sulfite oxidase-like oxidoreductase n=1 Tax=Actinophytocola xinjiangensis TaxID=485602 RepID=A0A7Z0WIL6_9PSEU|nr:molybdopterin-dependent oxidoreductase [Actinophytocola xinjiangensis]OLF08152.1 sulfite oxidase-like oxidoreductase [Actinophytocola xinjiangensis]